MLRRRDWFRYGSLATAAVLSLTLFASARPDRVAPHIVSRNCSGCHELDGRSQLPYVPRLAGLSANYTERKLSKFRAASTTPVDEALSRIMPFGSKDSNATRTAVENMIGIAHAISDEDGKAAVEWYAAQKPAPGRRGDGKLIKKGEEVFMAGVQSQNLAACQSCHGPNAEGSDTAPRLAGQNAEYLLNQLALFRAGDPDQYPEMAKVAKNIGSDRARAVVEYLQSR